MSNQYPTLTSNSTTITRETLLKVNQLQAWYGAAQILFDVNLTLEQGEVVALLGRNGAGKSTTLKTIMGLMEKRHGSVEFMGKNISKASSYEIARHGLGYVPEDRRIFSDLTVLENLEVGRQAPRQWPSGAPAPIWDTQKLFKLFPNLGEMPHRLGGKMSGGEQQMLTVARTLMGNPYLILLDEPSEGVSPLLVEQMAQMIIELKAQGVSVLLSEQNLHFAQLVSDRAYVIEKGQIQYSGTILELAANDEIRGAYLSV
jgi:branched-chain amino acid transport system ATP-binding protein